MEFRAVSPQLAVLLCLATPLAAQAAYTATATVDTAAATAINLAGNSYKADDPAAVTLTGSSAAPLVNAQSAYADQLGSVLNLAGTGYAYASVQPGLIQLSAAGSGSTNISPGPTGTRAYLHATGQGLSEGSFSDGVTWHVAGLPAGTMIYVDYTVLFNGAPGVTVNNVYGWAAGGADYQWSARIGAGPGYSSGQRFYQVGADGSITQNGTQFGSFAVTGYVTLGSLETLSMWVRAGASANGDAQCDNCNWVNNGAAASTFGQGQLAWGGVTAARMADGTPIELSRVSALGDSGFQYLNAAPVPEPGSLMLLLGGLGLGPLALRHRGQGRSER